MKKQMIYICVALSLLCIEFWVFVTYTFKNMSPDKSYGTQDVKESGPLYLKKIEIRETMMKPTFCKLHNFAAQHNQRDNGIVCVGTNTKPAIRICIHPLEKDIFVSQSIYFEGNWEIDITQNIMSQLYKNQEAGFIDIGANIGKESVFYFYVSTLYSSGNFCRL